MQQSTTYQKVINLMAINNSVMTLVDDVVITAGIIMAVMLYSGAFVAGHPRARAYLRGNLGVPFVIAFIVLLLASAVIFSQENSYWSNLLFEWAYLAILVGVILQIILLKVGKRAK
ncbi:MAG: hypothetical protein QXQ46_03625 [Thermoplasmatales archaeon]